MVRSRDDPKRVVSMSAGLQRGLPGGAVLARNDVVVKLSEQRERRGPKLTKRRTRIVEVQPPDRTTNASSATATVPLAIRKGARMTFSVRSRRTSGSGSSPASLPAVW